MVEMRGVSLESCRSERMSPPYALHTAFKTAVSEATDSGESQTSWL